MTDQVILIVDDDTNLLESISDILLLSNFRVVTAGNGAEALQVLQRERPDCIISDVMMPELDGYGLLEAVRTHEPWAEIPVILITAYDRPFSGATSRNVRPNAVLPKPFDVDQLIDAIRNNLS